MEDEERRWLPLCPKPRALTSTPCIPSACARPHILRVCVVSTVTCHSLKGSESLSPLLPLAVKDRSREIMYDLVTGWQWTEAGDNL